MIDALRNLQKPAGDWEIIAVDNGSDDSTRDLLNAARGFLDMKLMSCPARGKNRALNAALAHSKGELLVFTDDDILPKSNWLVELENAAIKKTDFDLFGGAIYPAWPEDKCPEWIPRLVNLGSTYAVTAPELTSGEIPATQIWGPNMAVRAHVFGNGLRFNEAVGPAEGQYIMGSEVDLTSRLAALGHRSYFVSEAIVGHQVRPNQLDPEWIIQRAFRLGRHMHHQDVRAGVDTNLPRFRGAPRWKYRQLLENYSTMIFRRFSRDFDKEFKAAWMVSFLKGYIAEAAACRSKE